MEMEKMSIGKDADGQSPAFSTKATGDLNITEGAIETELNYLAENPKHKFEKPYVLRFDSGGIIPNTNMDNESKAVQIYNYRPFQQPDNFSKYGFSVSNLRPGLNAADYYEKSKVTDVYYPAVLEFLWQQFPDATEIRLLEHEVRERHAQFPAVAEEFVEKRQPATAVHIDFSPDSAARTASAAFQVKPHILRRLLSVNVWKSIQGPGNDWPLAFCDLRTFDHSSELIESDVVFVDRYTENQRVYHNPRHKWYYYKDLSLDEVIMFRQTDSSIEGGGGVPHASFYNPKADANAAPRASIELRAFVIWK